MKQLVAILIGALFLPLAAAQDVEATAPLCPGALESSVVMTATGHSFTVSTEGITSTSSVFPTYKQTVRSETGTVLVSYEATKLNEGAGFSCDAEMRKEHDAIIAEISNAIPAGSSAKNFSGPELDDIIACLNADRVNCESQNGHQLEISFGTTDEDADRLVSMIESGAYEMTFSDGGSTSTTYYYAPVTGELLPVLSGGC